MKKFFISFILFIFLLFSNTSFVAGSELVVSSSANILSSKNNFEDYRVIRLKKFLKRYNSPLEEYAFDFVYYADLYQIDWRLVVAISGVESTFGKRIPQNSFNAYGWNNGNYKFNSWQESIEIVTKTLRQKYYDRGAKDIDKIARRYAPPSQIWALKVKYFMDQIDRLPVEFDF